MPRAGGPVPRRLNGGRELRSVQGRLEPVPWGMRDLAVVLGLALQSLVLIRVAAWLVVTRAGTAAPYRPNALAWILFTLIFELCLFGLAVESSVGKYHLRWADLGFRHFPKRDLLLSVEGALAAFSLVVLYRTLARATHLFMLQPSANLPPAAFESPALTALLGLAVCGLAPIAEEVFFRGFIFRGLLGKVVRVRLPGRTLGFRCGLWRALLVSSVLFAVAHVQGGLLLPFLAVSALYTWLYWQSRSLWPGILAHAGFNSIAFTLTLAMRYWGRLPHLGS